MLLGLISDTHNLLRPEAAAALKGVDEILHAGDIGDESILESLNQIAPTTAIRGNVDTDEWSKKLPETEMIELAGATLYLIHDLSKLDLKPEAAGIAAVIYGHSHQPKIEEKNGVLYINPGSAGPRRFNLPITIGKLEIKKGKSRTDLHAEIIELLVEPRPIGPIDPHPAI